MKSSRYWLLAAGGFLVAGYWLVSFLIATGKDDAGSSNGYMPVLAGACVAIGAGQAAQAKRR